MEGGTWWGEREGEVVNFSFSSFFFLPSSAEGEGGLLSQILILNHESVPYPLLTPTF